MATKMYSMSKPVLIEKIPRSNEVCKIICSLLGIGYQLINRKLSVQWEVNGTNVSDPTSMTVDADGTLY